jgi:trigger factor
VRRNKALATVLEAATVTDESGNPVDLSALSTPEGQAELDSFDDLGAVGDEADYDEADYGEADDDGDAADGDETVGDAAAGGEPDEHVAAADEK